MSNNPNAHYDAYKMNKNQKVMVDLKRKAQDKKSTIKAMNQTMNHTMLENNHLKATSRERSKVDASLTTDRERRKYNQFLLTQKVTHKKPDKTITMSKSPMRNIIKPSSQTPVHGQHSNFYHQPSVSPIYTTFDSTVHSTSNNPQINHNDKSLRGDIVQRNPSKSYKQCERILSKDGQKNLPNSDRERENSVTGRNVENEYCHNISNNLKLNHNSIIHNNSNLYGHKIDNTMLRPTKDVLLEKLMPKLNCKKSITKCSGHDGEEFSHTEPARRDHNNELITNVIRTKTTTKTEIFHTYGNNTNGNGSRGGSRRNKNVTDRLENISRQSSGNSFTNYNRNDQNLSADNRYSN